MDRQPVNCDLISEISIIKDEFNIDGMHFFDSTENTEKPQDTPQELVQFVITEFREREHKCSICDMAFYEASHLRVHMVKHKKVQTFHCRQCFKSFTRKDKLRAHVKSHQQKPTTNNHKTTAKITKPTVAKKKSHSVKLSEDKTFKISGSNRDRKFKCTFCDLRFWEECDLEDHIELMHVWMKDSESDRPLDWPLICGFCGKKFKTKYLTIQHTKIVHDESRDIKCHNCQQAYKNSIYVYRHVRECISQNLS